MVVFPPFRENAEVSFVLQALGYIWPFIVFGPMISAIVFGLVYTITPESKDSLLFGYQVLLGLGIGCATQTGVSNIS